MKNRTIKELLELMLQHQIHFCSGLCSWASSLYGYDLITEDELMLLKGYIEHNRPKFTYWHNIYNPDKVRPREILYYWECKYLPSRIKWIKKHIKLN